MPHACRHSFRLWSPVNNCMPMCNYCSVCDGRVGDLTPQVLTWSVINAGQLGVCLQSLSSDPPLVWCSGSHGVAQNKIIIVTLLASCLINAQPLPAHRPAADGNSLICCTSHELTDDWSLSSTHFVDSQYAFRCSFMCVFIEPDVLKTMYRSTIPIRFIRSICSGNYG